MFFANKTGCGTLFLQTKQVVEPDLCTETTLVEPYFAFKPRNILMVSSTLGSGT